MTHCTACRAARPQSARLLSLFDSLGPIMSGPSSSHTAGMARIGRMGRSLVGGTPERITLHFFGALSHTYKGHASDSAVVAGLIGEREDSPNVRHALRLAAERGVEVEIRTHPDSGRNPNTVSMELVRGGRTYAVAGVSVGGGEIEMTELEGFPVCLRGNEDGALFIGPDGLGRAVFEERLGALSGFSCVKDGERALYLCLAEKPFPEGMDMPGLEMFPVRNILGNKLADAEPLFSTLAAMAEMAGGDLPGLIERYEARRSGVDRDTIRAAVLGSWEIMKASMTDGLAGKSDMLAGLVPGDAGFRLARRVESGQALSAGPSAWRWPVRWRSWRITVPCAVWWRLPRRGPAGCCPARFFRRLRNGGSATTPSSTGCSSRRRWACSWPCVPPFPGRSAVASPKSAWLRP